MVLAGESPALRYHSPVISGGRVGSLSFFVAAEQVQPQSAE